MKPEEKHTPTLGEDSEIHLIEYEPPKDRGCGVFTIFLTIQGNWRQIFIEEDQLDSHTPTFETHDATRVPESMIERLSLKWDDISSICKHARKQQQGDDH